MDAFEMKNKFNNITSDIINKNSFVGTQDY